ncbi:MAG: LOG family protein [Anaerolineae bacterium]|nr:LOG family protein [Anaerolineae bacterium]
MTRRIVSVFGGSAPAPGSPGYAEAYHLGRQLAGAGYTVMTGGYGGTMEAAGKGAKEAGGRVIGVTVGFFEDRFGLRPNPYVDETIRYETLHERLHHLVARSDATVALRGGVGTLSEVALSWSLLQVGEIAPKPLVLVGAGWERILSAYRAESYVNEARDMALVTVVRCVEAVAPALEAWFDSPPRIPPRLSQG